MKAPLATPTDPADYRFCHRVRVRFAETDAMGVVHHAAYLPYLESGRVEYLRSVGHPYATLRQEGFDLPVVEVHVRYIAPLVFDELVDVHLVVLEARAATFEIAYLLTVMDRPRATAITRHAVLGPSGRPVRVPPWLAALAR